MFKLSVNHLQIHKLNFQEIMFLKHYIIIFLFNIQEEKFSFLKKNIYFLFIFNNN